MVRVLHSALMLHPSSGIINQMRWEAEAASRLKIQWAVKIFCPANSARPQDIIEYSQTVSVDSRKSFFQRAFEYIRFRSEYYSWLRTQAESKDILILRYSTSDPLQYFFIKSIKKPVYLVHHTLELPELKAIGGVGGRVRIIVESFFGKKSQSAAKGLIGVTDEIVDAHRIGSLINKNSYRYANGVNCDEFASTLITSTDRLSEHIPSIIFVASFFSKWHGLDLLLDSLEKTDAKFVLHLVGVLATEDEARARKDSRVLLHGHVSKEALTQIIADADVGLSSFALDRKAMVEACPLKTREYLAQGLPVYAGHRDVFPVDSEFYKIGPPDIESIIDFSKSVTSLSRKDVAEASGAYIEKSVLLNGLYRWIA